MARSIPPGRLDELVGTATRLFARRGFRRTQIADVARELGISTGSVYTYVESKDALFHACLVATSPAREASPTPLPLPTPAPGATRAVVDRGLAAMRSGAALDRALRAPAPVDAAAELGGIIGDLYDRTAASRAFQALLEGSAHDLPELYDAFLGELRRPALRRLQQYLERRIRSGHLREVVDVATTARLVVETQAWFAWHRHGDLDAGDVDDALARDTVIDVLVAGLLPRPGRARRRS